MSLATTAVKRAPRRIVEKALASSGAGLVLARDFGAAFSVPYVNVAEDSYLGTATLADGTVMDVGGSLYRLGVLAEIRGW